VSRLAEPSRPRHRPSPSPRQELLRSNQPVPRSSLWSAGEMA